MFRKILLPVIHDHLSSKTVEYAVNYAKAARGDIVLLCLTPAKSVYLNEGNTCAASAQTNAGPGCDDGEISEMVLETARRAGVHCDVVNSNFSSLSDAVVEFSKQYYCDVIYLDVTRNSDLAEPPISGAVINEIVKGTRISVLVFR